MCAVGILIYHFHENILMQCNVENDSRNISEVRLDCWWSKKFLASPYTWYFYDLCTHFVHVQFVQYLSSPSRIKSKSKAASYRRWHLAAFVGWSPRRIRNVCVAKCLTAMNEDLEHFPRKFEKIRDPEINSKILNQTDSLEVSNVSFWLLRWDKF